MHTSKHTEDYFESISINFFQWPAESTNLSPIKPPGDFEKAFLRRCRTFSEKKKINGVCAK